MTQEKTNFEQRFRDRLEKASPFFRFPKESPAQMRRRGLDDVESSGAAEAVLVELGKMIDRWKELKTIKQQDL